MNDEYFVSEDGRFAASLNARLVRRMLTLCREARHCETGGILIGRYESELRCAVISQITGPPVGSEHSRYSFYRAVGGLQKLLDKLWAGRKGYYLGEWHYHPGGGTEPSSQDHIQLFQIAKDKSYSCPEPLLLILGGHPDVEWTLGAKAFTRDGRIVYLRSSETKNV